MTYLPSSSTESRLFFNFAVTWFNHPKIYPKSPRKKKKADAGQQTRDEAHAMQDEHMERMQKQYPAADFKLGRRWWVPAQDFAFDVRERLDKPTTDKFDSIITRFFSQKLDPDAAAQVLQDARECLTGHPDLVESFDAIFKCKGPELLAAVEAVKQHGATCGSKEEPSIQGDTARP